jgi:hypothetical protein
MKETKTNMFNFIKKLLTKRQKPDYGQAVSVLSESQARTNDLVIAIARLSFIKPQTLLREVRNTKANGEYLFSLIEELKKLNK